MKKITVETTTYLYVENNGVAHAFELEPGLACHMMDDAYVEHHATPESILARIEGLVPEVAADHIREKVRS